MQFGGQACARRAEVTRFGGELQAEGELEGAARARGAARVDAAAHELAQLAADRQSESGAAEAAGGGAVGLRKGIEEPVELVGADADARVGDGDAHKGVLAVALVGAHADR